MENTLGVNQFYNYLVEKKFLRETKSDISETPLLNSGTNRNGGFWGKGGVALRDANRIDRRKSKKTKSKEEQAWNALKPKYYPLVNLNHENTYKNVASFVVDALKLIADTITADMLGAGVFGALLVLLEYLYNFLNNI